LARLISSSSIVNETLIDEFTAAVAAAAVAVRKLDQARPRVNLKPDGSPVTAADELSQAMLLDAVARLMPGIAVVAEEMASLPTQLGDIFVLVDPLDGTREYIAGSSEYTINLAIVQAGDPIVGIVAAPALGLIYRGMVGSGAERLIMDADSARWRDARSIRVRSAGPEGLVAMVSRSHLDPATVALLDRLGVVSRTACGSALKFCRIAEGEADIYPRLATTCEWDVAAGHALVVAAGGTVTSPDGSPLSYGGALRGFRIPAFVASARIQGSQGR
jgi:3'(2'), 5'-bisphosphate nucleotidase